MKKTVKSFILSAFFIAFSSASYATDYYSPPINDGYSTSGGATSRDYYSPPPAPQYKHKHHKSHVHVSLNVPANERHIYPTPSYPGLMWLNMQTGFTLPRNAVIGGNQPERPHTLFVCRGDYHGGIHPGKLVAGYCNISWGGQEIRLASYQVLVSNRPLRWASADHGYIPTNAIAGGYENQAPLFICQVNYQGGTHTGKVVGNNCNFGWGGREISIPYYFVLVG